MLVISHRGYHVDVPENTLEAFEQAFLMGVDGIETDVCLSVDPLPILFHDRLTPDGREVSTVSREELSRLVRHPVPTLDEAEVLIARSPRQALWNLEVKHPGALDAVLALVDRRRSSARFLITSFRHTVVQEAAARGDFECGMLVCHRPLPFAARPEWLGSQPNITTVVWEYANIDAGVISDAARCGLKNLVWGAATPADHRQAAEWGIDGIITDRPEFVLSRSR